MRVRRTDQHGLRSDAGLFLHRLAHRIDLLTTNEQRVESDQCDDSLTVVKDHCARLARIVKSLVIFLPYL